MTPVHKRVTPIHKNVWLWAFLAGIILVTLMRPLLRRVPAAPPVLGQLPPFVLVDPQGEDLDAADLDGSAWILAFFSTRDDSVCGGLIESMTALGQRYDEAGIEEVRLLGVGVSPSVAAVETRQGQDPGREPGETQRDGPESLLEYGVARGLAAPRWTLATGAPDATARMAGALVEATGGRSGAPEFRGGIPRPCRLYLVDGAGGIRGAYRDDRTGLDEVFHRAQHVAQAEGP